MIQHITDYLMDNYGFTEVPCNIPKNKFERIKRSLYITVNDYLGFKCMSFIRKIYPIKVLDDRPDRDVWLRLGNIEAHIEPFAYDKITFYEVDDIFSPIETCNYKISIYNNNYFFWFYTNLLCYPESIKNYLMKVDDIKSQYRNKILDTFLREN